ncbi:MAG: hypothetical protein MJD61_14420 [Proteobacteria bacterium]|nr:hypothetical protein [Pseudomonadota bacterium]
MGDWTGYACRAVFLALTCGCTLAGLIAPPRALADGRYPAAQQVIEDPRDPRHLIVRATYGLLVTPDAGKNWLLICEEAVGYGGNQDPVLGLFENGNLMAGLFGGLALASEDGCSWSFARGGVSDMEIIDVTVDPAQRAHGLALATKQEPDRSCLHRLWHTSDNGTLWQELGPALPAQL